jgi:hypothetical protein
MKNVMLLTVLLSMGTMFLIVSDSDAQVSGPIKFQFPGTVNAKIYVEEDGRLFKSDGKYVCECPNSAATCKCKVLVLGSPATPDHCFDFYRTFSSYSWEDDTYMYFDCAVEAYDVFDLETPGMMEVALSKAWISGYCIGVVLK